MLQLFEEVIQKNLEEKKSGTSARDIGARDFEFFAKHYFPHIFNKPMCKFHHDLFKDVEDLILNYSNQRNKLVRAAPRGHGKSRIISVASVLWVICYRYRQNILLLADTLPQTKEYIETIKKELEENALLHKDFGDLVGTRKWREDEIITSNDVHVIAKSSGQGLRGASYNNVRPEFVVLDDLENDENVETEGQRNKLKNWFEKVLMPIGNDKTAFLFVGTVLHYESLLYTILTDGKYNDWNRRIYKAVNEFNTSPLWEEWEKMFTDVSDEDANEKSYAFFKEHEAEMTEGIDILWSEREPDFYYNLMKLKLQNDEAFNSEYQNNPMTEDSRVFKDQWLKDNYYEELPKMKEIYASVDLSMGKTRTADFSAIIFVGRGVDNYFYVLEADVRRRTPDIIIKDIVFYLDKYDKQLDGFIVETNVFQEFFANTLKEICVNMGIYVNWIEERSNNKDNKGMRIRSLAPKIKNGYIKFNKNHTVLLSQLKNFPKDHDDAPDALERCINRMSNSSGRIFMSSVTSAKQRTLDSIIRGWGRR